MENKLNPWVSIWTKPKETINEIATNYPKKGIFWLAMIAGFQHLIIFVAIYPVTFTKQLFLLFMALLVSPVIGIIWFYYFGFILYIIGKWLKGSANCAQVRAAYAWSRPPIGIYLAIVAILLFVFPELRIHKYFIFSSSFVVGFIGFAFGLWALLLFFQNILQVQKFEPVKAILNIVFAYIVNFIIAVIVIYFFMYLIVFLSNPVK